MDHGLYEQCKPNLLGGFRDLSPQALLAHGGAVRVIDVREPGEWTGELGHIAQAELTPLATVAAAAAPWDRGVELVVVCRSGGRSARAAALLVGLGFQKVMNLEGGMLAYRQLSPR